MTLQRTAPDVLGEKFDLNERQALFVYHYTADPERNATQAAKDAGYSERSAHTTAGRLLKIEKVEAAIAFCYQSTTEKLEITRERVLKEIASIAFVDVSEALHFPGEHPERANHQRELIAQKRLSLEHLTKVLEIVKPEREQLTIRVVTTVVAGS